MYGLEVRKCVFILTDDVKNKFGSLLNGQIESYEVIKNGIILGQFLHVSYRDCRHAYLYPSSEVSNLPCEELLYLRTLIED